MSHRDDQREDERAKLLRRLAYIRHGPGQRAKHEQDGPDPRVEQLRRRLRELS